MSLQSVALTKLRFRHDSIAPVFRHGDHAGETLDVLIDDLLAGRVRPSDLRIEVERMSDGNYDVVDGHRRLFCIKEYFRRVGFDDSYQVHVVVVDTNVGPSGDDEIRIRRGYVFEEEEEEEDDDDDDDEDDSCNGCGHSLSSWHMNRGFNLCNKCHKR